ncbi:L-shaped tail fiber protein assembly [Vibrio phage pVp-1]|uniref:Tail protein n=1 Tax=Vibrio phage pVp-1 TaxID=1150989 RepID=H6WXP8_9CAUD|nr:L-shaped tail fiber protein assembly [Vibrio phage pVp-1]AFB84014.1 tail protein [Vibrio phage pVp-1]
MSKIVNLKIEEGATFAHALKFTTNKVVGSQLNPLTNQEVPIKQRVPISLTGYTIVAQLRTSFSKDSKLIVNFETTIASGTMGLAYIGLTKEQTAALGKFTDRRVIEVGSNRVYDLGYYDVLLISPNGSATRIYQGKCYLSRAATLDPLVETGLGSTVTKSPVTPIEQSTTITVDKTKPHYFAGIRYFSGGIQSTPTGGVVNIYKMPDTSSAFQSAPVGTLAATVPTAEVAWYGNSKQVKAVPKNITGADSYQLVVVSNIS